MILLTGASGKTGKAILRHLRRLGAPVRAFVRRDSQAEAALQDGASEVVVGDLLNAEDLRRALPGVARIYHICPNMHPDEVAIGQALLDAARDAYVERFVYHSVLHPQTEEMLHHWNKMLVEGRIFQSGLPFTILQPCAYMQNILPYWDAIVREGHYSLPYSADARLSLVDLEDVAEVASIVLTQDGYAGATFELAGPQALSARQIAAMAARLIQREVVAKEVDRRDWRAAAEAGGMSAYAVENLLRMFVYYEQYDFIGNPQALAWLLGRPPHTFLDTLKSFVTGG